MKKTNKKGFTIVELVIVIAVIAILAAVLIPNISRLVKKANQSADESLVRNLNTALAMDTEKHTTMSAALTAAYENGGYDVAKIVTKNSDAKILWDSVNDCFVYLNGTEKVYLPNTQTVKNVKDWNYFEICNEMPATQKYSIYANWEGTKLDKELTVGFDAGKNVFESLTFKTNDARTVIINTNGGALTVEAKNANVTHYGDASIVTVTAVAKNSYHENGTVNEIRLAAGRVVVEGKAEVGSVLVTASAANNVAVEVKGTATLGAVGADNETILTDLKKVVSGSTEVIETKVENNGFAGGFGTEKAPYLVATAEQFKKISGYVGASFKQINDIVVNFQIASFSGKYDGNGYKISTSLSGHFCLINSIYGNQDSSVVFKNMVLAEQEGSVISLIGSANNEKLPGKIVFESISIISLDNAVVNVNNSNFGFLTIGAYYNTSNYDVEIQVIGVKNEVSVSNTGTCTAVFFGQGIDNNESYKAEKDGFWGNANINVIFKDCINTGDISGASTVGLFTANYWKHLNVDRITVDNCSNSGTLISQQSNGVVGAFSGNEICNEQYQLAVGGTYSTSSFFENQKYVVKINDNQFYVDADNTSNYKFSVVLNVQDTYLRPDLTTPGNGWKYVFDAVVDKIGTEVTDSNIVFKAADVKTAIERGYITSDEAKTLKYESHAYKDLSLALITKEVEGKTVVYMIFEDSDTYYIDSSVSVMLYAYTAKGVCLGVTTIKR